MICESCGIREATQVLTEVVEGEKQILYRCCECAESGVSPRLERPCEVCRKQERSVKLTRLKDGYRSVVYLCQTCAQAT